MKPAAQKPVDEDNKEEGKQDNVSPTTEDTLAAATAAAEAPKIDHGNIPHGTLQGYDDDSSEDENEKDTWHEKMRLVLCLETDKEIAKQYKLLQMGSYPWLERYEKYYVFVADEVHDFFKLVCNKFNDASWIPSSKAHPTMHPDFEVPRKFPKTKGKFTCLFQLHCMLVYNCHSNNLLFCW